MKISRSFKFCASHRILSLPVDHKCHRHHGHNYRVDVTLSGEPDERGLVMDFGEITKAWAPLYLMLDHYHLNDIEGLELPTSERLAQWILAGLIDALPLIHSVRVWDGDESWAEVSR
jgi:6-pyruvoyltetrahydropterin/6-carboxytetrahydropterin synthase